KQFHLPKPPPLGVSIRTRSPACICQLPFEVSCSLVPSWRMIHERPTSPSWPPCNPYGARFLRSESSDIRAGANVSISRIAPSPPLCLPLPPDPLRIEYRRTRK